MSKVFVSLRKVVVPVFAVVAAGILFTACLKNKNDNANVPAAGVMAFNLAPDQESVVITLSGNSITYSPLGYTNFTGTYQPVYTGDRTVSSFDYPNNSPLATTGNNFEQDKYYSVFVIGIGNKYRNVVSTDNLDSLSGTGGNAYIRYVNAITDSVSTPAVTIAAAGNNVVNENATYASVSEFKAVTPGEVSITVNGGSTIAANRTITVEARKIYTVLLSGVPGATDDAKKVQIKFIQNGTITDDPGNK
jgi:Domain of unknown function (DUF4397)